MTHEEIYKRVVHTILQANMHMERTIDNLEELQKLNDELSDNFYDELSDEQAKRVVDLLDYSVELFECIGRM